MQSAQACTGVDTHVATCEDIIEVGALICHLCQGLEYPGCSGHGLLTLPTVDTDDKSVLDAVLTTANLRMHAYGHAKPHRDWPFKKFPGGGPVPSQHCRVGVKCDGCAYTSTFASSPWCQECRYCKGPAPGVEFHRYRARVGMSFALACSQPDSSQFRSQHHSPAEMKGHGDSAKSLANNGEVTLMGYIAQCPLCCSTAPVLRSTEPRHYGALNDDGYFTDHDSASARADQGDAQRNAEADKAREKRWRRARAQINEYTLGGDYLYTTHAVHRFPVEASKQGDSSTASMHTVTPAESDAAVAMLGHVWKRKLEHYSPLCAFLDAVSITPCTFVETEVEYMMKAMMGSESIDDGALFFPFIDTDAKCDPKPLGYTLTTFGATRERKSFASPGVLTEDESVITHAKTKERLAKANAKTTAEPAGAGITRDSSAPAAATAVDGKKVMSVNAKATSSATYSVEVNKTDQEVASQWGRRETRMPGLRR